MLATLQGIRTLDFTANNGERVQGTQLFVSFEEAGVTGFATDKLFVRTDVHLPDKLKPNTQIEVFFDRKGKPEAIIHARQ
ncbi:MAG: hypothetical protein FWB87_15585 [Defluviitaleaceae bacterium]|nr:hypothetical protein [Defluviitaleaceae bacterium]